MAVGIRLHDGDDLRARRQRTRAGEIPELPGYEGLTNVETGGTAEVFRARETATGKVLALKYSNNGVIPLFEVESGKELFIAQQTSHPLLLQQLH